MGTRSDQYIGLNAWAANFVQGEPVLLYTEETTRNYPDGHTEQVDPRPVYGSSIEKEECGYIEGAWNDHVASLLKYTFPNGKTYQEAVQAEPWSSGPCYFVALKDETGNWVPESLWSPQEIESV